MRQNFSVMSMRHLHVESLSSSPLFENSLGTRLYMSLTYIQNIPNAAKGLL